MSIVWAVIAATTLALILYGIVNSRMSATRRRAERERLLPSIVETFAKGARHDLRISDGSWMRNVEILGMTDPDGASPLGGWQGLLVVQMDDGRKAWLRASSIRSIVETPASHAA